jgi:ABC-type sugar transport system substrate-binding protein
VAGGTPPALAAQRATTELLKETLPKLSRLAILWQDASNPYTASVLKGRAAAAGAAQVLLQSVDFPPSERPRLLESGQRI